MNKGFTMIELLISITLVAIFSVLGFTQLRQAQLRALDARRKSDLEKIKVAFEDYYNDHSCYPAVGSLDVCGGGELAPYLNTIPCDPSEDRPYEYVPLANECQGYRIYTQLQSNSDEDSTKMGCQDGCGYTANPEYNYGVAAGTTVYYTGN